LGAGEQSNRIEVKKAVQITKDENGRVLRIQGSLAIGEAAEIREALRHWLAESSNPVLDFSAVDACDTAAVQLLYSARKTAGPARHLRFVGLGGAVTQAAAALGLEIGELTAEDTLDSRAQREAEISGI
jgi:anti-anti-sigma regulatory factor